jgi:hypothetical protein
MTHVHAPVIRSNAAIAEQAREVHPLRFIARLLITIPGVIFLSLGWAAGTAWFAGVFSILWAYHRTAWFGQCMRVGFHKGARHKLVEQKPE